MDNILQPLRQYVIHIRSKDSDREGELNSHIFVDLVEPITINPTTQEIHMMVLSGEIPYSFYNISPNVRNNELKYSISGVDTVYTFPSKMYDINELIRQITDDTNLPFTATYDKFTMKIILTSTSPNTITIKWTESNCFKVLGFSNKLDKDVVVGGTTTSDNVIDLATIHSLQIKSSASSNMVFSTRAGFSQTIQKVSVDVNSGDIIYLNHNDSRQHTLLHSNIEALDLRITDQNDNLINFNNINYEISIGFFIYPINIEGRPKTINTNTRRALTNNINNNNSGAFNPPPVIREDIGQQDINTINNDITNLDNEETDAEHKTKRLIIDEVISRMSNN